MGSVDTTQLSRRYKGLSCLLGRQGCWGAEGLGALRLAPLPILPSLPPQTQLSPEWQPGSCTARPSPSTSPQLCPQQPSVASPGGQWNGDTPQSEGSRVSTAGRPPNLQDRQRHGQRQLQEVQAVQRAHRMAGQPGGAAGAAGGGHIYVPRHRGQRAAAAARRGGGGPARPRVLLLL